jgi:hypothetical protein
MKLRPLSAATNIHPALKRHRVLGAITLLAAVLLIPVGAATPASASSDVCVAGADVDLACIHVYGSGGYVNYVQMQGNLLPPDPRTGLPICDYSAQVRISAYGDPNYLTWQPSSNNGCSWGTAWLNVNINATFPTGSSWVCGAYYVKGVQQGREMCIKLTKSLL